MPKQPFLHFQGVNPEFALQLYDQLLPLEWGAGIRTRNGGFTRHAIGIDLDHNEDLLTIVCEVLYQVYHKLEMKVDDAKSKIKGIYINYYKNGEEYTPNHTHRKEGSHQLVISLGCTRTFVLGKKEISAKNGDVMFFGNQIHGIPKDPSVKEGRISIAVFVEPI